jgi:hypothetical protein
MHLSIPCQKPFRSRQRHKTVFSFFFLRSQKTKIMWKNCVQTDPAKNVWTRAYLIRTGTSFTKPGPAILTWHISFTPCLLISIIKSTKWRFLSSLFINRSFNTFRSTQCEQFKEKLSEIWGWSSFCGTLSLISQLIYDDIANMFHLTAGNG